VTFLLQYDAGTHDSIRGKPFRQLGVPARVREQLVSAKAALGAALRDDLRPLLLGWYHQLSRELDQAFVNEHTEVVDANVRYMCVVVSCAANARPRGTRVYIERLTIAPLCRMVCAVDSTRTSCSCCVT
jgi:hypothetical protein